MEGSVFEGGVFVWAGEKLDTDYGARVVIMVLLSLICGELSFLGLYLDSLGPDWFVARLPDADSFFPPLYAAIAVYFLYTVLVGLRRLHDASLKNQSRKVHASELFFSIVYSGLVLSYLIVMDRALRAPRPAQSMSYFSMAFLPWSIVAIRFLLVVGSAHAAIHADHEAEQAGSI